MKTIFKLRFLMMVLLVGSFMACKKNDALPEKLTTSEMAQRLYTQKDFVDFAGSFAKNFKYLTDYYQTPALLNNKASFVQEIKSAGNNEFFLEAAHIKYGMSFKEIILRKSLLDDTIIKLYNDQPDLLNYTENEFWSIIMQSISLLKGSNRTNTFRSNSLNIRSTAISADEIWDCIKEAVGLGAGSMLGIAGLHALAQKKGIQKVVTTFAAFMARNMGYIGLAITVIDFSSCMYKESMD